MINQSPLERAARALSVHNQGNDFAWEVWLDDARAVLIAIRTPSEEMVSNGAHAVDNSPMSNGIKQDTKTAWVAMIDSALEDSK